MSPQDSTLLLASAKINLALQVTGLKDDGYHLLSSLVACVNFGDEITIIPSAEPYNPSNDLTIAGEFVGNIGAEKNNLITRAIELCQAASGQQFCGKVMLEKKNTHRRWFGRRHQRRHSHVALFGKTMAIGRRHPKKNSRKNWRGWPRHSFC